MTTKYNGSILLTNILAYLVLMIDGLFIEPLTHHP